MKRFYKSAAAVEGPGGWGVALDDRPVRTPVGAALTVPCPALAEAIVGEWDAQGEKIDPPSMPMMKLAATTIDRVVPGPARIAADVAHFGEADLLCYRADGPDTLVARQTATWQPLIDWAAADLGAALKVTAGIGHVAQDTAATEALRSAVEVHDPFALTALLGLASASGSVVIALAVSRGHLDAEAATAAAQLDETYQAEHWGIDKDAETRRRAIAADIANAARFLDLLRAG